MITTIEQLENFSGNIYDEFFAYLKSLNINPNITYADNQIHLNNIYWHDVNNLFKRIIQKKAYLYTIEYVNIDYDISEYAHLIKSEDPESFKLGISLCNQVLFDKLYNLHIYPSGMKAQKILKLYTKPNISHTFLVYQYKTFLNHEVKLFKKHKILY